MKVVIASQSPVKKAAVEKAFDLLYPNTQIEFICIKADSGVSNQPNSDSETREGALGRIKHAKEIQPGAEIYLALEGGICEMYGDIHCFGWVVAESNEKQGFGRTFSFVIPPGLHKLMVEKGLEQSHAPDEFFATTGTKTGNGLIGPLTNNAVTYTDWYIHAVVSALVPILNSRLY